MTFSFWYNRCCVDPVTVLGISTNDPPEYVDLIRYESPGMSNSGLPWVKRCSCECPTGETAAVIVNTTQQHVDTAINMNPMSMNVVHRNKVTVGTYFVAHTFLIPSVGDLRLLGYITRHLNVARVFACTRFNILEDEEIDSIYKLIIYQRRYPYSDSRDYIEWMSGQIRGVIGCRPLYYSTDYISPFAPHSYITSCSKCLS